MSDKNPRRGFYILPNLFTTASLFAGFYAIVQAMNGNFEHAPIAIFVAIILDGLDGRVARWTHTESDFGAEYDSLSDMVSFGLAPALVMYEWALSGLGKIGWLAAFLYAACAGLRLARFNTQHGHADPRFFQGLPSPSGAALVAGLVWAMHDYGVPGREISFLALAFTVFGALAMVSNFRYFSIKQLDLRGRVSFVAVLAMVLVFVLISSNPPQVLFLAFLAYALSGPLLAAARLVARSRHRRRHPRAK
ncbi:MAG TPA: CDP-diacylglycerol--serine O-phosphatidyltransferase [Acidiferrobacterales bacterium]|jgi:CDP-diacylglycerol--serine O-phosphatidyltransferase